MGNSRNLANLLGTGSTIATAKIADEVFNSNRNLIINGAMQVAQRGTSAVAVPNGGYSTVDRMRFYESTGGAYTSEQSSDVPAGQGFSKSIKLACTTADSSIGAAEIATMSQVIEGQNLQRLNYGTSDAKTITLSFWVKSNKTGIYTIAIYKHAGGGTAYGCPVEYTISSANTWEKKTITVTPTAGSTTLITSSAGAIIDSNGQGIEVHWGLAWGSNYNATNNTWSASGFYSTSNQVNWLDSTSNNFYLTGVQLEIGDVATPFEHRSFGEELFACQRYYSHALTAIGVGASTTSVNAWATFPRQFRATPTYSASGALNFSDAYSTDFLQSSGAVNVISGAPDGSPAQFLTFPNFSSANVTQGRFMAFPRNLSNNNRIVADAEL